MINRNTIGNFAGCLLGGACGDALGRPVEFCNKDKISRVHGPKGITSIIPNTVGRFEITDDTQMTLFTAEGLLRAWTTARLYGGVPDFSTSLKQSYCSWLSTQGDTESAVMPEVACTGWLLGIAELHQRRAPGNTCLSAHREVSHNGPRIINNNSKGCGGVMRVSPAGLLATRINSGDTASTARLAFELGCRAAALTHGHPSGYYPAGVFAALISTIICGGNIIDGVETGLKILDGRIGSMETIEAVKTAIALWNDKSISPSPAVIESLGGGWVGEEALAISLYCALSAESDFRRGVLLAVNHSGDSDSTGSITGNILGALLGQTALPSSWLDSLELIDVISQMGKDLYTGFEETGRWLKDYPPVISDWLRI